MAASTATPSRTAGAGAATAAEGAPTAAPAVLGELVAQADSITALPSTAPKSHFCIGDSDPGRADMRPGPPKRRSASGARQKPNLMSAFDPKLPLTKAARGLTAAIRRRLSSAR